jgi:hypothetical protein
MPEASAQISHGASQAPILQAFAPLRQAGTRPPPAPPRDGPPARPARPGQLPATSRRRWPARGRKSPAWYPGGGARPAAAAPPRPGRGRRGQRHARSAPAPRSASRTQPAQCRSCARWTFRNRARQRPAFVCPAHRWVTGTSWSSAKASETTVHAFPPGSGHPPPHQVL